MKKYITAVALLVAGTAFANAEATLLQTWDGFEAGDYTNLGTSTVVPDDAGAIVLTGSSKTDTRVQFDISSLGIDFSANLYLFELEVSSWSNGNGPIISWGTATGTTSAAQKYGFGFNTSSNVWAATQNGGSMAVAGESVSVLGKSQNSGTLQISIGTSDDVGLISVVFTDTDGSSYTLMDNVSMTFGENESIACLNLGGWASTSGNPSGATVSLLSISLIPEPSAFGMLAGLGALALVASRRRRK